MSLLLPALPQPECFFHYQSMVEAMFSEDPQGLNEAMTLSPRRMLTFLRRYHRLHVQSGVSSKLIQVYERTLAHNLLSAEAVLSQPGTFTYRYSLN
jgi:hypothetical protein